MYSKKILNILKRKKIKIGDEIEVIKNKKSYKGILMPRIELGDKNCIVLKLENGYNIGISSENVKIKLIKKGKKIKFEPSKIRLMRDKNKRDISILGCGGTIASRIEYKTGAVFPAFSPSDLIQTFPELKKIANIHSKKLFDLLSEDMTPKHWQIIAKQVAKEIKNKKDGIILMHGTDTMHYTSAALSFMLQNLPVPVILVGAQRSSDRGSSDNQMNLNCAALAAAKSDIAEVSICMHGTINDDFCYLHQGTHARKLHTSRRDAFRSIDVLPYAKVWYEKNKITYLRKDFNKRDEKRKLKLDTKINSNVALVYSYPGIKPEFFKSLRKYDGIVLAGTGLGHVPTFVIDELKSLIKSGIPVVMAPQTIYGRINMNVYKTGRLLKEIGVIGDYCNWTPETALVKLMWVLGHTKNMKKIRDMMLTNYVGEISKRSIIRGFLI